MGLEISFCTSIVDVDVWLTDGVVGQRGRAADGLTCDMNVSGSFVSSIQESAQSSLRGRTRPLTVALKRAATAMKVCILKNSKV